MLHCTYQSSIAVELCIDFCCRDNRIDFELLHELQSEWVKQTKNIKTEVNFKVTNVGIASTIEMSCSHCKK